MHVYPNEGLGFHAEFPRIRIQGFPKLYKCLVSCNFMYCIGVVEYDTFLFQNCSLATLFSNLIPLKVSFRGKNKYNEQKSG